MYYQLYNPENVNSNSECDCPYCKCYPELFHAIPYSITPYRVLETLDQAKSQLKNFPDAIIIEKHSTIGYKNMSYKNINTGSEWNYNGIKWVKKNK